ncbi:MAG TPA: hypothetical protein VFS30_02020 [Dehalococcoidia bacterium]|nr:hypothetical protein [Dehalococcoidia bacterium]
MGKEIELFDSLLLHINHGKASLTGQQHDRGLNFLIGVLLSRAFNSLWRAREDAVVGYAPESLTVCRSAMEHWIASRWVELNPEARDHWLWEIFEEVSRPIGGIPGPTVMVKELGSLAESVTDIYGALSKFAHPRGTGLRWVIHFDAESTYFHVGLHFDHGALKLCLYFLMGTAQACLEPVARLQNRMLGRVDDEWLTEGNRLSEVAGAFMESIEVEVKARAAKLPPVEEDQTGID